MFQKSNSEKNSELGFSALATEVGQVFHTDASIISTVRTILSIVFSYKIASYMNLTAVN